jgi:hypothetical protein
MVAVVALAQFTSTSFSAYDLLATIGDAQTIFFSSSSALVILLYATIALLFIYASFNIARPVGLR